MGVLLRTLYTRLRTMADKLLKITEVMSRVGLSKTTIYLLIKNADFPKQVKIFRSARWKASEVDAWIERQS